MVWVRRRGPKSPLMFFGICQSYQDFNVFSWSKRRPDKTGKRTQLDAYGKLMMVHTSDSEARKSFDALHDDKAADPRHPRVSINTDGFSVFGLTAAQYSCWPIFVFPLNLPPGQIMQRKNILPDVDNSRAQLSGEKYECVHATA